MEYLYSCFLIIALISFIFITIFLKKHQKATMIIIFSLGSVIFIWKAIEFTCYAFNNGAVPVEISHIAYFLTGGIIVVGYKKLYFTGGIFAFVAGFGYLIGGVVSPNSIINSLPLATFILGIISHLTLLFLGINLLFNVEKYNLKDIYIPFIFFAITLIYVYLAGEGYIYDKVSFVKTTFVYRLIHGEILNYFNSSANNMTLSWFLTALVYILFFVVIFGTNYLNNLIFKKRENNRFNIGICPLTIYLINRKKSLNNEKNV